MVVFLQFCRELTTGGGLPEFLPSGRFLPLILEASGITQQNREKMGTAFVQKTAFLVPFTIGVVIIGIILWYARVHQPLKKLRPPFGQLLLIGIVLTMLNAAVASLVAKAVLTGDEVHKSLTAEKKRSYEDRRDASPTDKKGRGEKQMSSWDRIKYGEPKTEQPVEVPPEE